MVKSRAIRTGLCLSLVLAWVSCATVPAGYPLVPSASPQNTEPANTYYPPCSEDAAACAVLGGLMLAAGVVSAAAGTGQANKDHAAPKAIRGKCWLESSQEPGGATPCFGMVLILRETKSNEESYARPDPLGQFGFLVIPGKTYALSVKSKTLKANLESYFVLKAGDEVVVRLSLAESWPDAEFAAAHAAMFRVPASDLN